MNRVEKRKTIRNLLHKKGLKKKHTKGAFGEKPSYLKKVIPPDMVAKSEKDAKNHNIEENK